MGSWGVSKGVRHFISVYLRKTNDRLVKRSLELNSQIATLGVIGRNVGSGFDDDSICSGRDG